MAAAILMMNMQGAVMAADKDQTIFRYSDEVPFALMTEPKSKLPWEDIWEGFRAENTLAELNTFKQKSDAFAQFTSKYLANHPDLLYYDSELTYNTICVGYEPGNMFPIAAIFKMDQVRWWLKVDDDYIKTVKIGPYCHSFYQATSECQNLKILFGGMSSRIAGALQEELASQLGDLLKTEAYKIKESPLFRKDYYRNIDDVEKDPLADDSFRYFTVKDLVAMEENLIDIDNLSQSSTTALGGSYTREIGVLTLAEGFKWIKHSLYSA